MHPLHEMRAIASAPGKVILFGEHAVVFGHPAVAACIDQRTRVEVDVVGSRFTVNGHRLHERYHSYIKTAVDRLWKGDPVRIQTEGGIPSASGTGSSAALTTATVAALHRLQGITDNARLAQDAFMVERVTQGGGSPIDTSVSTAGGAIAIAGKEAPPNVGDPLWDITWEDRAWSVESLAMPGLTVVVGNSGVKGKTDVEVAKVAHNAARNPLVRDTLQDIGSIARDAVPALRTGDWETVGRLMSKQHDCMHMIGVNHPEVQKLVVAVRDAPGTLGAKITGAGGGGSMVAITDNPARAAAVIEAAGGRAFIVRLGGGGATLHAP